MATSTSPNINVAFSTAGKKTGVLKITANGVTVEKAVTVDIKPPVPTITAYQQGYAWHGGSVTGGSAGSTIHVYNYDQLKAGLKTVAPLTIIAHGIIAGTSASVNSGYQCEGNKTLIGAPNCEFRGFNLSWFNKTNVLIRNIKFTGMPDFLAAGLGKKDYITFYNTTRICVNHCHFVETVGTDSHMDIIDGSDWITVSDNIFEKGDKGSLCGAGVEPANEIGKLHASYFRNRWIDIMERGPSYRNGSYCHCMNELHQSPTLAWQYTYACGSRNGATMRVENCDFTEFDGWAGQAINQDANSTEFQIYGYFSGISTNLLGPNATFALKGQPESSWVEPYDTSGYKLTAAATKAFVLANAGATLTLAQMGY